MKPNIKETLAFLFLIVLMAFNREILQLVITAGDLCAGYFRQLF